MNTKITKFGLVMLIMVAFLSQAMAAIAVDINSATKGGVDCASADTNYWTAVITGASTGLGDSNKFAAFIRPSGGGVWQRLTIEDNGNGTVTDNNATPDGSGIIHLRIIAPSASLILGGADLNIADMNGTQADGTVNIATVYVIPPIITATEFTDINADICGLTNLAAAQPRLNLSTFSNYIQFKSNIDINKVALNFDGNINMDATTVQVYSTTGLALSGASATIYFGNTVGSGINNPEVWYRPSDVTSDAVMSCPGNVCSNLGFTDGTTQFDVTGFSYYELRDKSTGMGKRLQATGQIPISGTAPAQGTTDTQSIVAAITGAKLQIGNVGVPIVYLGVLLVLLVGVYALFIHKKR